MLTLLSSLMIFKPSKELKLFGETNILEVIKSISYLKITNMKFSTKTNRTQPNSLILPSTISTFME